MKTNLIYVKDLLNFKLNDLHRLLIMRFELVEFKLFLKTIPDTNSPCSIGFLYNCQIIVLSFFIEPMGKVDGDVKITRTMALKQLRFYSVNALAFCGKIYDFSLNL